MKKNEVKQTIEQVVRVEYIAEDGQIFYGVDGEEECRKYEESALFAVSKKLRRLNNKYASEYDLNENGSEDNELEIFDIQTKDDLENLRRYLYLRLSKNGASETSIKEMFTSENGRRENFVFDNITAGHEVLIFWGYDQDWGWTYGDGSLNGYFEFIRRKYNTIIAPKESETKSE